MLLPHLCCPVLQAYASMKPLAAWTRDLVARMEQISKWASTGAPPTLFWPSGFTFPTGFLTAVLQTTARKNNVSPSRSNHQHCPLHKNDRSSLLLAL